MEQRELAIRSALMRRRLAEILSKPVALDSHNFDKSECTLETFILLYNSKHSLVPSI